MRIERRNKKMRTRMKKILDLGQALGSGSSCKEVASLTAAVRGDNMSESDALLASLIHNEIQRTCNSQEKGNGEIEKTDFPDCHANDKTK